MTDVKRYISSLYAESTVTSGTLDSGSIELQGFEVSIQDVLNQFFVNTATWGLKDWESYLGIITDESKPSDQRRSVIKSKIRGIGTVTAQLVESVAEAYDRGNIEVTEQPEFYQFTVKFIDTMGLPPNLDDLKAAIDNIKPAHLAVTYSFRYLMLAEIEAMTLEQVENTTMDKIAWG